MIRRLKVSTFILLSTTLVACAAPSEAPLEVEPADDKEVVNIYVDYGEVIEKEDKSIDSETAMDDDLSGEAD